VLPTYELHLLFAADGRLSERRIVEMPAKKILVRQTYDADGVVKVINPNDGKVLAETKLAIAKAEAPNLQPATKDLLVMEFPVRTPDYLFRQISNWNGSYANLDANLVERIFVSHCLAAAREGHDSYNALKAFGERFRAKGDRRIGFYTLYNLTNTIFNKDTPYNWGDPPVIFNVEKEHPDSALARYLAHYQQSLKGQPAPNLNNLPGPPDGFIQRLARFRNVWNSWIADHPTRHGDKRVQEERVKALAFIQETNSPLLAWAIIESVTRHGYPLGEEFQKAMDVVQQNMGEQFGMRYFARYEQARGLLSMSKHAEAGKAFQDLYLETFKSGALPPIDANFVQTVNSTAKEDGAGFAHFLRARSSELLKDERLLTATLLAWQTWQLGQQPLADELFNRVLASAKPKDKNAVLLIGIEYLWQTGQFARADVLLQQVLADPKIAERPGAWRLSAALSQRRGLLARSVASLEKAMDLEFRALPEVINLDTVRNDYRGLLGHYQQLAMAITFLDTDVADDKGRRLEREDRIWQLKGEIDAAERILKHRANRANKQERSDEATKEIEEATRLLALKRQELERLQRRADLVTHQDFLAKVVKAADRWRSLDPDNVEVCQLAARILQIVGAKELAWDYVTTPIGMKPNEAAPWLGLANSLRQEAEFELADRAYSMAYGAEPTNADILWNRAQNLQQFGKLDQARTLYRQIADGTWQPRFQGIVQQARGYLER
jgi:Tfp pilus assembly protein PilF